MMTDNFKPEPVTADDEIGNIVHKKMLTRFCSEFLLIGEERTCMPKTFLNYAQKIKEVEVRDDDVWVISFPKSGTTWTQEMVWLIANNLDYKAAEKLLSYRFPFLELSGLSDSDEYCKATNIPLGTYIPDSLELIEDLKPPRFIKTHLPFSLLPDQIKNGPKQPKIVYVYRNPKDACVSTYHYGCLLEGWTIDIESFAKVYLADRTPYAPYWKHLHGYWKQKDNPRFCFVQYEEMKKDLSSVIKRVAKFLEKDLTDDQIETLIKHLSFESMRDNKATNVEFRVEKLRKHNLIVKEGRFMRCGVVGKYKEELRPETVCLFDQWIKRNVEGTPLFQDYDFSV